MLITDQFHTMDVKPDKLHYVVVFVMRLPCPENRKSEQNVPLRVISKIFNLISVQLLEVYLCRVRVYKIPFK